jgi:3-oxoacyl-[acyl-carrier protein] reductase
MDLGLTKRHALVTGASRGLGRAIASALAAEGAEVVAVARNLERLNALVAETPAGGGTIADASVRSQARAAIESLGPLLQQTDILVLNTGGPPPGPVADTPDAVWSRQFEAMFLCAIRLTRLALPGMRQRGFGRILAVVSSGVIQPIPNLGISNALRAALVGWAKTLAGEVASDGITVNCVAPGRIATDRVAELDQGRAKREGIDVSRVEQESRAVIPVGRYGDAAEFASVAAFLASPRASYMTGGIIRVDGGMIRSV